MRRLDWVGRVGLLFGLCIGQAQCATRIQLLNRETQPAIGLAVYLVATTAQTDDSIKRETPIVIAQQHKRFVPYVQIVQRGATVEFINRDDISHHIYSLAAIRAFDFKLRAGEHRRLVNFTQSGSIAMGCNIHDWMSGYLLVVDTPYFALSDHQGVVDFGELPSGQYQLHIWHPQLNEIQTDWSITLPLQQPLTIQLQQPLSPVAPQQPIDDLDFLQGYDQ